MLTILTGLQIGCGGKGEEQAGPEPLPPGPKGVAITLMRAQASGDGAAAAACYDCSAEDKEYIAKLAPFAASVHRLVTAANKAYGAEVWLEASVNARVGMRIPDVKNASSSLQCEITGNTAKCIMKGIPRPLTMHKKDGKWLIVPRVGEFPPLAQRGDKLKLLLKLQKAIEAAIPKVGAPGVSADAICKEIREAKEAQ